jgi:hypothetical protein
MRIRFRNREQLQIGALRSSRALLPAWNRIGTNVQEPRKQHLADIQRTSDRANISWTQLPWWWRKLRNAEVRIVNPAALVRFKHQRVPKRFTQFIEYFHLDFLGHCSVSVALDSLHQLAEKRAAPG